MDRLTGIVPPLVTPFTRNEEIDEGAVRAEVQYMVEEVHAHGLVVGGSTGEGHTLGTDELQRLVRTTIDGRRSRARHRPASSWTARGRPWKHAALDDPAVAALQVTPVHYLFRPTDDAMHEHFTRIAEASSRPVMIYNVVPWSYCSPRC